MFESITSKFGCPHSQVDERCDPNFSSGNPCHDRIKRFVDL